jgi:3-dehydroquinate synthetase
MIWNIKTALEVSYAVKCSTDLFSVKNTEILRFYPNKRVLIVFDEKVGKIYRNAIEIYFIKHGVQYRSIVIDGIEAKKDLDSLIYVLKEIELFGVSSRVEPILAIGGGVILDIVGLASNLYRRGIPYIRVPTTLLGMIDVSIAAKTGINFENRRNRLGSYYPPIVTFVDKIFLKTLNSLELSSGLGEILKMAVSKSGRLFELLEFCGSSLIDSGFEHDCSDEIIELSIQGMKEELENNLWEKDLKRIVDFGHSFSPIIEMRSLNSTSPLTHGQAVTLDVIFSCAISNIRGMLSREDVVSVMNVAKSMSLQTYHASFTNTLMLVEALNDTTKHRNGNQNLPIPCAIGNCVFVNDLTINDIDKAIEVFVELNKAIS